MKYRRLGSSGLRVSALSFGAWVTFGTQIGEDVAQGMMQAAIDAGVNFFDNAEVYAGGMAETIMGKVVKKAGWKRSDLVFSTKIFWGGDGPNDSGLSRKHIIEGVDAALERLQMDYVDLVFAHRPDLHTPVEETVRAFNHVIEQGKAFYWGTSEWSATQIMEAHGIARELDLIPPTMEQPQYHMFHRERFEAEYARLYQEIGLGTTIWSPLASGLLTGKYNQGMPAGTRATLEGYEWLKSRFTDETALENIAKVGKMMNIADELGCTMAQLALAWTLKNPNVSTTITGASRVEQVVENMKAIDYVDALTPDVMEAIEAILDNKPTQETDWR
ncbi:MAG: aldo/keto reductase [Anaerolineae bacterium]|jgi:voltage-dependent potassium channel beta subunit|nr:aldo/keto reductase [Anaerolineae bacterium]MBT7073015.1 aldo/keto reductase [Anaerolineae bacterium]MBT7325295.1 aldo/keto reductase [Anaerolineae bacterium]